MLKLFLPLLFFFLLFPSASFAQPKAWTDTTVAEGRCVSAIDPEVATIQGLECIFYNILQVIVIFAGLAFFVMFIVGGFQYLFSSNDPKAVAQASSTLTMAFIAVVGIILSWFILKFITNFTGINVLNFVIPS